MPYDNNPIDTAPCLTIDGSMGEGGGQVLRAALALSLALERPFQLVNIRAKRPKPGLKRQHLTCARAAQALCGAEMSGDALNSTSLFFKPGELRPGEHSFAVGTGGSVTLVLQALVPALLFADAPSSLTVTGGTHVPYAPPFEFLAETLLPRLELLGPKLTAHMDRIGYMESGGGRIRLDIQPVPRPDAPIDLSPEGAVGPLRASDALLYGHGLPESILDRETATLLKHGGEALDLRAERIVRLDRSDKNRPVEGAGNMVIVRLRHGERGDRGEQCTVFAECGWRGRSAEVVAKTACKRAREFVEAGLPVECHLADQLLVPLALAGGGSFLTKRPSAHLTTCLEVIRLFTGMDCAVEREERGTRVRIGPRPEPRMNPAA